MKILVLNCGSSSIKYQLFTMAGSDWDVMGAGVVEKIGLKGSFIGQLRNEGKDILPDHYDTDFNIFRWIKAYEGDMTVAQTRLKRHLKFRAIAGFDN